MKLATRPWSRAFLRSDDASQACVAPITSAGIGAAFGDSHMNGLGSDTATELAAAFGFPFQDLGVNGDTTAQIEARLSSLDTYGVKFAVINGGINDVNGGTRTLAQFLASWTAILDYTAARGIHVVVLQMFPAQHYSNAQHTTRRAWNVELSKLVARYAHAQTLNMDSALGQFRAGGDAGNLDDLQAAYNLDDYHLTAAGNTVLVSQIAALKFPVAIVHLARALEAHQPVRTVYTTPGTYTHTYAFGKGKNRRVHVRIICPGGGGGSGRKGAAASDRYGGGGGGGGSIFEYWLRRDDLGTASDTVVLGSPGVGGAAVTTDSTNGFSGSSPGLTTFAGLGSSWPSTSGSGGTNAAGSGGAYHAAGGGSSTSANATNGSASGRSTSISMSGGGGGGGGVSSGDTPRSGGNGGGQYETLGASGGSGTAGGTATNGGPGSSATSNTIQCGAGGGGGGGSATSTKAGDGGTGGSYGGGGGGGGGGTNTGDATGGSGKGGDGGPGIIIVDEYP